MDAQKAVSAKIQYIFCELAGERAEALRGDAPAGTAQSVLAKALEDWHGGLEADELAFHLLDWNADAAFLVAFLLFPERFTESELRAGVDMLLLHVPAHVLAAARVGGV